MGTYERELRDDMLKDNGIFANRSAGSLDIDLSVLYNEFGCIIEVKSSKKKTVYLSGKRLRKQFNGYGDLKNKYNIPIYYAFRWKTRKHMDKIDKWKIYEYDSIEKTKDGNPILRWDNGSPLKDWIKCIKEK